MKRQGYISWDEYFMGIALLAAERSKDPNTQVGACIVSPENIIISTGYNGLLNAGGRVLRGARLYVALFPCNECAKAIIQAGIAEIVYLSDKYNGTEMNLASKRMLDAAGVRYHQLPPELRKITLDFSCET